MDNRKRIVLILAVIVSLAFLATGCGISNTNTPEKKYPPDDVKQIKDRVVITESNYFLHMVEIFYEPDSYVDAEIEVMGFLYKEEEWEEDLFLLARFFMNCCEDDVDLVGYLSKYEGTNSLRDEGWYKVVGIFKKGSEYPYLEIKEIEEVDAPENPYIQI